MRDIGAGGVGLLVSTVAPGLVGLDLDNVIVDGVVHALGLEAIEHFKGSYVEVSPSGTGMRIFCLGELLAGTPKGSTAIVGAVKFEAYPAGTNRFLRTTGELIPGTVGEVANCQDGLDWFAGVMIDSKVGSPDKASPEAVSIAGSMTLDAVFDALPELRPDKDSEAVIEEILSAISSQPRGKLAEAWRGNLTPWNNDHSTADLFMACEAVRRGAGVRSAAVNIARAAKRLNDLREAWLNPPEWTQRVTPGHRWDLVVRRGQRGSEKCSRQHRYGT